MNLRDYYIAGRKYYLPFTQHPVHSIDLFNERQINRRKTYTLNTSFMWSKSPWEQNIGTGKPLHLKAKFNKGGGSHAKVLDKEVGPHAIYFKPDLHRFWVQNLWSEHHGNRFWGSETAFAVCLRGEGQRDILILPLFQMSGLECWSYMPWASSVALAGTLRGWLSPIHTLNSDRNRGNQCKSMESPRMNLWIHSSPINPQKIQMANFPVTSVVQ